MIEADIQKEILSTLTGIKDEMDNLKVDVHQIKEFLEDTKLTEEERKLLDESVAKVKAGNTSDFVSHEDLKKELNL